MTRPTALTLLSSAALAGGLLAGCGVQTEEAGQSAAVPQTNPSTATSSSSVTDGRSGTTATTPRAPLPQRPAGTVAISVQEAGSITAQFGTGYQSGATQRVTSTTATDTRAYQELCAGRVDAIEVSTVPGNGDYAACRARGLEIVNPLLIASDAVVIATKNEADVGGDCITVKQARDLFRSGSPYSNWSQLGFDDLRIRAVGREAGSDAFSFFAFQVLGIPNATLGDVRSDYVAYQRDQDERRDIVNADRLEAAQERIALRIAELRASTRAERRRFVDAAERSADRRVLRLIARENARRKRLKITVDAKRLAADNRRRDEDAKRTARLNANLVFEARLNRRITDVRAGLLRGADQPGAVGPFRFTYYELFEEQLRPLEIDYGLAETGSGQPVRYGDLSPADQRRVAPQLRAARTESASASGTAASREAPGGNSPIPPDTVLAGVTDLPAKTAKGQPIFASPSCVFPSQTTITTGAYPLARRTFVVTTRQALRRNEVRQFLIAYVQRSREIATSDQNRLVPVTDQQQVDNLETLGVRNAQASPERSTPLPRTATTSAPAPATTTAAPARTATTPAPATTSTTPAAPSSSDIPGVSSRGSGNGTP